MKNLSAGVDFWSLIEKARITEDKARIESPNIDLLNIAFSKLPAQARNDATCIFRLLLRDADRQALWQLCSLMIGQPCGDDSFEYFRRWLVLQGEYIYKRIVSEPDIMAELLRLEGNNSFEPFVESAGSIDEANFHNDKITADIHSQWSWTASSAKSIQQALPNTWKLLGARFVWDQLSLSEEAVVFECEAQGLGTIRVGDRLLHTAGLGAGIVRKIILPDAAIAEIDFESETKSMVISSAFFNRR
ncbi:DUF4240 domain-containing protein [Roseateles sp. DC23W]|uniref:DUF4240 domain-containing protein n=1 Tax=Pelomonas dachongensis TaxID=3299029 RepID=A0ABW7ERL2_9BURK